MSNKKNIVANNQDFWSYVKRQYKKNKAAVASYYVILFLVFIAIFADFLANEKPLIAKYNDTIYFPALKDYSVNLGLSDWPPELLNVSWQDLEYDYVIWAPIPYLPQNLDFDNAQSVGPFDDQNVISTRWRHWLGTDELGRDVLSGMIHATRIALSVGVISMTIASFIGIIFGAFAGFFGDDKIKMSLIRVVLNIIGLGLAFFYAFSMRSYTIAEAAGESLFSLFISLSISLIIFLFIMTIMNLLAGQLKKLPFLGKRVRVPIDIIISRLIEVQISIPVLILIISVVAIVKPSIIWIMLIIGLTRWTGIARFIRAELLKIRSLEYIEAASALGFTHLRILFKHAIPNALSPVLITVAFGIAGAILTEAILSLLGIGVPAETVTWGSLLSLARHAPSAWWLAIFPGFAIFITVTVFNLVGEGLTDALDPRQKK